MYGLSAAKLPVETSWHSVQAKDDDALASICPAGDIRDSAVYRKGRSFSMGIL